MKGACGTYGGEEKYIVFCDGGNLKGRDYSEDIEADERIILKWVFSN